MTIHSTEALARKAHSMAAKLSKQNARLIAAANKIGSTGSSSGSIMASFRAGLGSGGGGIGRPKSSIRAKSHEGLAVFHFRMTPITRGSIMAGVTTGKPTSRPTASSSTSSASHQLYIERDEAVELTALNSRETNALEIDPSNSEELSSNLTKDPLVLMPDHPDYAAAAAGYIDREGVVEATASSFGNIASTVEERISFWRAVEESESKPAKHKFTINPGLDQAFWDFVENDVAAPKFLKGIAATKRDAILVEYIKVKDAQEIYTYFLTNRTAGPDDSQTIAVEHGRGGRVQTRMVLELPSDMTAIQRLEIAKTFCQKEFEDKDVRYHCAIHRPTKSNDERNYHMHITFHDRPAERMLHPETGLMIWDFEFQEKKRDSSRHYIMTRTKQQNKIREFQDIKWPRKIRADFALIVNSVRKNAKMAPIYDARNYKEMGIEVEAVPSLTRRQFHDIQRGVPNPGAAIKIDKRWERLLIKMADETPVALPNAAITMRFRQLIQDVAKKAPVSIVTAKAAHGAYLDATRRVNEARLDRVALKIAVDKEISWLIPEIGAPKPGAKKAKAEIEQIHTYLELPLHRAEALARESQQVAIQRLIMLEKQLKTLKAGSLSLRGRSFSQLSRAIGITNLPQMLQASTAVKATPPAPPAPNVPFKLPEWMRPENRAPVVEAPQPAPPIIAAPPVVVAPKPAPTEWIDPMLSWGPARPAQKPVAPTPAASTRPPQPVSKPASVAPPAKKPIIEKPAVTMIVPAVPIRTPQPSPQKSAMPTPKAPIAATSPAAANPSTRQENIKRGLDAARASLTQPLRPPSIADKLFPVNSSAKPTPENLIPNTIPKPKDSSPAIPPAGTPLPVESQVENDRKEQERRDKRRAILTNPKPPLRKPDKGFAR